MVDDLVEPVGAGADLFLVEGEYLYAKGLEALVQVFVVEDDPRAACQRLDVEASILKLSQPGLHPAEAVQRVQVLPPAFLIVREGGGEVLPLVYVLIDLVAGHLEGFRDRICLKLDGVVCHFNKPHFDLPAANLYNGLVHDLSGLRLLQLNLPSLLLFALLMLELTLDRVVDEVPRRFAHSGIGQLGRSDLLIAAAGSLFIFQEFFAQLLLVLVFDLPAQLPLVDC